MKKKIKENQKKKSTTKMATVAGCKLQQ